MPHGCSGAEGFLASGRLRALDFRSNGRSSTHWFRGRLRRLFATLRKVLFDVVNRVVSFARKRVALGGFADLVAFGEQIHLRSTLFRIQIFY